MEKRMSKKAQAKLARFEVWLDEGAGKYRCLYEIQKHYKEKLGSYFCRESDKKFLRAALDIVQKKIDAGEGESEQRKQAPPQFVDRGM